VVAHEVVRIPVRVVSALEIGGVAGAYYLSAHPGVAEAVGATGHVRMIWPASGIGVAVLLIFGLKVLPGLVLGAGLHSLSIGRSPLLIVGITLAVSVGAATACVCLRRVGFRNQMDRARDAVAFVVFAAVSAMMVAAALYGVTFAAAGESRLEDAFFLALATWMSWGLGVLVVTPVLLVLGSVRRPLNVSPYRLLEVLGLVLTTVAVTYLAVAVSDPMLFLVFPILIWVARRFQHPGTAPCVLVVSAIVVSTTMAGAGPFSSNQSPSTEVILQAFIGSLALASLFLAVGITERDRAREEILQTTHQLADVVRHVERHLRPHEPAPEADQPRRTTGVRGADTVAPSEPAASGGPDTTKGPTAQGVPTGPGASAHSPQGEPAEPRESTGLTDLTGQSTDAVSDRDLIERAIGNVMQQRKCDLNAALTVLRGDAEAAGESLRDCAAKVIARASRRGAV
jgi:integral membrane sensor domain MASE1